jgi:hypothetical protein
MIRKSAWLFPPSRVRSTYPKYHDQQMLAQDNTATRTLKWVSDHALNCPQQWLRLLGDSPLCAEAVRRCGTELNRRERDAWLLRARLQSSDVWTWPKPPVRRSAAVRQLSGRIRRSAVKD